VIAPDNRKRTLVYTRNTRPTYEIFSGGAIQAGNAKIAEAFVVYQPKVYQPIHRAESMDYESGTEFYKQSNASYNT